MKVRKLMSITLVFIILAIQLSVIPFNNLVYALDTESSTNIEENFHYAQLTEEAKRIYEALQIMYDSHLLETGNETYKLVENGKISSELIANYKRGDRTLTYAMNAARYAFYADHPEIFYVDFSKIALRVTDNEVYIGSGRYASYLIEGFTGEKVEVEGNEYTDVGLAIKKFNDRVDEIVEGANNAQKKDSETEETKKVRYVHDEIINNVSYRIENYVAEGDSDTRDSVENQCFGGNESFLGTPYGALVKKQAVCEGYARAFKTVLDRLGITCILVQGVHQYSGEVAVAHMWNYVKITDTTNARSAEEKWYMVDCTQDDPCSIIALQEDIQNYQNNVGVVENSTYGKDGFENVKYLLAGNFVMSERHRIDPSVEAAGGYEFNYPELEDNNFGAYEAENADGLKVTYEPDASITGDDEASLFTVSYRGMGCEAARKQGIYFLIRYNDYIDKENNHQEISEWTYVLDEVYSLPDFPEYFKIYENTATYIEFAVTDKNPGELKGHPENWVYHGDESDFIARTEKIYNKHHDYKAPPYIQKQNPSQTAMLAMRPNKAYHITATWDEDLIGEEGKEFGYEIECTSILGAATSGAEYSKITNLKRVGERTVEFDMVFSEMYADDTINYHVYMKGLIGKQSKKEPNPVVIAVTHKIECPGKQDRKGAWDLYGKPTLIEKQDLSMNNWEMSNGTKVSDILRNRVTLVTTKTTTAQEEKMQEAMDKFQGEDSKKIVTSETYNISLSICKAIVIRTGHKVTMKIGFPAGYGPESEGVTFKAYHFSRNEKDEITGVEEIDCVVTQYGLIITTDAYSPFEIAVLEGEEEKTTKSVLVEREEGGTITSNFQIQGENGMVNTNLEAEGNILTIQKDRPATINVAPEENYEIETLTVCGENVTLTPEEKLSGKAININYDDVTNTNNIVYAKYALSSTVAATGPEAVQEAVPATINLPETQKTVGKNGTLVINANVETLASNNSYQWYKADEHGTVTIKDRNKGSSSKKWCNKRLKLA